MLLVNFIQQEKTITKVVYSDSMSPLKGNTELKTKEEACFYLAWSYSTIKHGHIVSL